MSSPCFSGGFCVVVERFLGALSLACLPRVGGWIQGRGECGQWRDARGNGDGSAWNGGQGISNLLFIGRNSLVFNMSVYQLPMIDSGEVLELGEGRRFQTGGGGGRGRGAAAFLTMHQCGQNLSALPPSFRRAQKTKKGVCHV
jgi:hypothetical protein